MGRFIPVTCWPLVWRGSPFALSVFRRFLLIYFRLLLLLPPALRIILGQVRLVAQLDVKREYNHRFRCESTRYDIGLNTRYHEERAVCPSDESRSFTQGRTVLPR